MSRMHKIEIYSMRTINVTEFHRNTTIFCRIVLFCPWKLLSWIPRIKVTIYQIFHRHSIIKLNDLIEVRAIFWIFQTKD